MSHNLADLEATRNAKAVTARALKAALNRDRHNLDLFDTATAALTDFHRADEDYLQAARADRFHKAAERRAALASALDHLIATGPAGSALVEAYLRATSELDTAHEAESRYSSSDLDLEALGPRPSPMSAGRAAAAIAEDAALQAALDTAEQLNAATFEQAFAALAGALDLSPHRLEASEETTEIERLDAVTFALDKLPPLDPHRVTDALQKSAALAALAAAAAAELQAAAESHEVAFRPDLDLSLAVTARAELRFALGCLDGLADLAEAIMRRNGETP